MWERIALEGFMCWSAYGSRYRRWGFVIESTEGKCGRQRQGTGDRRNPLPAVDNNIMGFHKTPKRSNKRPGAIGGAYRGLDSALVEDLAAVHEDVPDV
jgi:hypothetical protein